MNQQDQKGMSNLSFVGCHTTTQKDLDTTIEDSLYRDVPELLLENIIHQSKWGLAKSGHETVWR